VAFKEETHVPKQARSLFQPSAPRSQRISLRRLWQALPEEDQQQTLQVLSRIVAQQLQAPPGEKEVPHEDR
jgi:hypothetical protein